MNHVNAFHVYEFFLFIICIVLKYCSRSFCRRSFQYLFSDDTQVSRGRHTPAEELCCGVEEEVQPVLHVGGVLQEILYRGNLTGPMPSHTRDALYATGCDLLRKSAQSRPFFMESMLRLAPGSQHTWCDVDLTGSRLGFGSKQVENRMRTTIYE